LEAAEVDKSVVKVLVVDDESNMRFLIRMILESAGHEVVEAAHGAAALDRVKESRPDVMVTDLMMPVMSGRELVARLRADPETASLPIIVVSANSSLVATAADAVLGKPFDADALVAAVGLLAGSRGG
jgi:CheY-like chemotaxis protein